MSERKQILGCGLIDPSIFDELDINEKFFMEEKDRRIFKLAKKGIISDIEIYENLKHKYPDISSYVNNLTKGIPFSQAKDVASRILLKIKRTKIFNDLRIEGQDFDKTGIYDEDKISKLCDDFLSLDTGRLSMISAEKIKLKAIEWIWPKRITKNKFFLLTGKPGRAKSLLFVYMASIITTGRDWPDAPNQTKGSVLFLSCEDDAEDTLGPRLKVAGCEMDKIKIIYERLDLNKDLRKLQSLVKSIKDLATIFIDPVNKYSGQTQLDKIESLNPLMSKLMEFSRKTPVTIMGSHHTRKDVTGEPMDLILGSRAWSASPRVIYGIEFDEDKDSRLLMQIKNNLTSPMPSLQFKIRTKILPELGEIPYCSNFMTSDKKAEDIMTDYEGKERAYALRETTLFLKEILKNGPVESRIIFKEGKQNGLSEATLNRAKCLMEIDSAKIGKQWFWMPLADHLDNLEGESGKNG